MILPFHPSQRLPVELIVAHLGGLGLGALGTGGSTSAETVGELAGDGLEVTHAAGTGGLPPLGLLAPVDCIVLIPGSSVSVDSVGRHTLAGLSSRVSARSAGVLLDVEGATTCASPSQPWTSKFPFSFVRDAAGASCRRAGV